MSLNRYKSTVKFVPRKKGLMSFLPVRATVVWLADSWMEGACENHPTPGSLLSNLEEQYASTDFKPVEASPVLMVKRGVKI